MNDTEGKKTTIRRYLLVSLRAMSLSIKEPVVHHDTQHNDTRLNGTQHNNFQFNNKKTRHSA